MAYDVQSHANGSQRAARPIHPLPQIGVRNLPSSGHLRNVDTFEIDALDTRWDSRTKRKHLQARLLSHQGLTLAYGLFFLRGEDATDRRERARLAAERFVLSQARASHILVPPSVLRSPSIADTLSHFREEFLKTDIPLPRLVLPDGAESFPLIPPFESVGDPTWISGPGELKRPEWRIQGKHPARWVRLYSQETLDSLAQWAKRHRPERILFAHSQRFVQAEEFAQALRTFSD